MNSVVVIHGKPVSVRLSSTALARRASPLLVEMGLCFGCAARKQVRFLEGMSGSAGIEIMPRLAVCFSPVVSRACTADGKDGTPRCGQEPVHDPAAFVSRWLHIDNHAGDWRGEFGYTDS